MKNQQINFTYLLFENVRIDALRSIHHRNTDTNDDSHRGSLANQAFQLANAAYKKGDFEGGLQHYATALKNSYQSHEIHNNIGVLRALRKQFKLAVESLKVALQLKPSQTISIINLANVYLRTDKYQEGITLYLQMMKKNNSKRVEQNFNRILRIFNSFSKYITHYLKICSHKQQSQQTNKIIHNLTKQINYSTPILISTDLKTGYGSQLKSIFDLLLNCYNKINILSFNDHHDQYSIREYFKKEVQLIKDKHVSAIVFLILAYYFNYKKEPSISIYFYSLIEKFDNPCIKIAQKSLHRNFVNFKKQHISLTKNKDYSSETIIDSSDKLYTLFKRSIYRFQISQKLIMFWFHDNIDIIKTKQLPQDLQQFIAMSLVIQPFYLSFFYKLQEYGHYRIQNKPLHILMYGVQRYLKDIYYDRKSILSKFNEIQQTCQVGYSLKDFYLQKAFYLQTINEFRQSHNVINRAQKLFPQQKYLWYAARGSIFLKQNDVKRAIKYLQYSLKLKPKNQTACRNYGYMCIYFGNISHGLNYITTALQINPYCLDYYFLLAFCFNKFKEYSQMILQFLRGINKSIPINALFRMKGNLAIFYICIQYFQESYQYLCCVLQDGQKQIDYNGEDLHLIYFYRMLLQGFNNLLKDQDQSCLQCSLYLLILEHQKLFEEKYQRYIFSDYQKLIQSINKVLVNKIINQTEATLKQIHKFDQDHKHIIYSLLFQHFISSKKPQTQTIFQHFKHFQKAIIDDTWVMQIQLKIRQAKIQNFLQKLDIFKLKQQQTYRSFTNNKGFFEHIIKIIKDKVQRKDIIIARTQCKKKYQECKICKMLSNTSQCLYRVILIKLNDILRHISNSSEKFKSLNFEEYVKEIQRIVASQQFSAHQIVNVTCQQLQLIIKQQQRIKQRFIRISRAFLDNRDINSYRKMIHNLIQNDATSQNSNIIIEQSLIFFSESTIQHNLLIEEYLDFKRIIDKQKGLEICEDYICSQYSKLYRLLLVLDKLYRSEIIIKNQEKLIKFKDNKMYFASLENILVINPFIKKIFDSSLKCLKECDKQEQEIFNKLKDTFLRKIGEEEHKSIKQSIEKYWIKRTTQIIQLHLQHLQPTPKEKLIINLLSKGRMKWDILLIKAKQIGKLNENNLN